MTIYERLANAEVMERRYKNRRIELQAQINKLREEMLVRIDRNGWKADLVAPNRIEIYKNIICEKYREQVKISIWSNGDVNMALFRVKENMYEVSSGSIHLTYEDIKMIQDAIRLLRETSNV